MTNIVFINDEKPIAPTPVSFGIGNFTMVKHEDKWILKRGLDGENTFVVTEAELSEFSLILGYAMGWDNSLTKGFK